MYLVGSVVLAGTLSGCGHGFFQAEREPWRGEAEVACLKSGQVREGADVVRISPISGPGVCGADFPLHVSALGTGRGTLGFADEDLRPPARVGYGRGSASPPQRAGTSRNIDITVPRGSSVDVVVNRPGFSAQSQPGLLVGRGSATALGAPVVVKPTATLACPIVAVLDRYIDETVQPAALHWFGQRVVEIKQVSAYSCRGMNGNAHAHISEHAFGNALDIAAFILADGREVTVRSGWYGLPEEQGFMRDLEAGACQRFSTVLAPGSNAYHDDHIHLDLMRRASARQVCEPAATSGELVASHMRARDPYGTHDPDITGTIKGKSQRSHSGTRREAQDEAKDD